MLNIESLLLIALLAGLIGYWNAHLKARELASRVARRQSDQVGMQFLDQTVGLQLIRLRRLPGGRLGFGRVFAFEFSSDGADRRPGQVVMLGTQVESIYMDMPEAPTWQAPEVPELTPGGRLH